MGGCLKGKVGPALQRKRPREGTDDKDELILSLEEKVRSLEKQLQTRTEFKETLTTEIELLKAIVTVVVGNADQGEEEGGEKDGSNENRERMTVGIVADGKVIPFQEKDGRIVGVFMDEWVDDVRGCVYPLGRKWHSCRCGGVVLTMEELLEHQNDCVEAQAHICHYCGEILYGRKELRLHYRKEHNDTQEQ